MTSRRTRMNSNLVTGTESALFFKIWICSCWAGHSITFKLNLARSPEPAELKSCPVLQIKRLFWFAWIALVEPTVVVVVVELLFVCLCSIYTVLPAPASATAPAEVELLVFFLSWNNLWQLRLKLNRRALVADDERTQELLPKSE